MNDQLIKKIAKFSTYAGVLVLIYTFIQYHASELFFVKYLSVFSYFISLSLGACFLIVLYTLTRGGWGVMVKRVPEHIMSLLPIFALLFIPILFGVDGIFDWVNEDNVKNDILLQIKAPYLNLPFFIIRNIFYFTTWSFIALFYWKKSIAQDYTANKNEQEQLTKDMQRKSPVAILLLSLTTSFASFDWIMSLFPHWFSTIFGVYYFAGSIVFCLSVTILIYEILGRLKLTTEYPNVEHFHDLSKLLYGFIIFWAYISFSQYFLTWYANIPEFTQWYYPRLKGDWGVIFYVLIIFHFIVPLFGFMSRHVKRNTYGRIFFCVLMIIIHYVDIRYAIFPNFIKYSALTIQEVLLYVGFFFIVFGVIFHRIMQHKIIPTNDPRYNESKKLENAL